MQSRPASTASMTSRCPGRKPSNPKTSRRTASGVRDAMECWSGNGVRVCGAQREPGPGVEAMARGPCNNVTTWHYSDPMTQSGEFLEFQSALAGEYSLQRELGAAQREVTDTLKQRPTERRTCSQRERPRTVDPSTGRWFSETRTAATGSVGRVTRAQLNRRARNRSVGAEHTAVTRLRLQQRATRVALEKPLARVGRHRLFARVSTGWTRED